MPEWTLVPCLVSLRGEITALAPGRDKASDGSIGDQAHSHSSSDHNPDETGATPAEDADSRNEVHAIDVDRDLRRAGWSMARVVQIVVTRHRLGLDDRLQNAIFDGKIWSRSWGWTARKYTGSNPHDKHAHFSARYTMAQENDTRPWGILAADETQEDDGMAEISQARFTTLFNRAMHDAKIGNSGQTFAQALDQIDQTLNAVRALGDAFRAFVVAEGVEDAKVLAALDELTRVVSETRQIETPTG